MFRVHKRVTPAAEQVAAPDESSLADLAQCFAKFLKIKRVGMSTSPCVTLKKLFKTRQLGFSWEPPGLWLPETFTGRGKTTQKPV
jgi:hypothetical protein